MNQNSETNKRIKELNNLLTGVATVEDLLVHTSAFIARIFKLDLVSIFVNHKGQSFAFEYDAANARGQAQNNSTLRFERGQILIDNRPVQLPLFVKRAVDSDLAQALKRSTLEAPKSFCILPILHLGTLQGWIECQTVTHRHPWTTIQKQVLNEIAAKLAEALESSFPGASEETDDVGIVGPVQGDDTASWVVLDLLADGKVLRVSRGLTKLLGIAPELARAGTIFDLLDRILVQTSRANVAQKIRDVLEQQLERVDFHAEVVHAETHAIHSYRFQVERSWARSRRVTLIISGSSSADQSGVKIDQDRLRSMRLVEYGNLIIIRTDLQLRILDVLGDTTRVFGVAADELLHKPAIWNRLLNTDDFRRLAIKMRDMGDHPSEFEHEIELTNISNQRQQHLFLTAIPIFSAAGRHIGWEGYGLDVTEKRRVEDEIKRQNRRIQALYEIAGTMQSSIDPAFVALRGLKALMAATKAVFGHCVLYDRTTDMLEILATVGCDHEYVEGLTQVMAKPNLSRDVIASNQGMLIDDMRTCPNARYGLAARAGARACIAMPMAYEDLDGQKIVVGALQIASRRVGKFSQEDFDLVSAAAAQMAVSIRQAEFAAFEKREASSLATLYRLSHALTRLQSVEDITEVTFPIIMSEIACRRVWLGILNEQGTHIVGVGAYGPGLNDRLAHVQIELNLRHDFIDQVVQTRQAVIVPAGTEMECSALNTVVARLKPGALMLVPLVVLGQVVGVLILEPIVSSNGFLSRKLSLLLSMANEMATAVLTRRLEEKIVASEKMRMAGLLASGVAHNFNNLLQAVMGQASLLSLQLPEDSPQRNAVNKITDAAQRGAELIQKMLSLSDSSPEKRQRIDLSDFLRGEQDLMISLLGRSIDFKLETAQDLPAVDVDPKQLQQVLTSILVNARDALTGKPNGLVEVTLRKVRLKTAQIDPDLAPGEYLVLTISDNGPGMDANQLQRCFEPFYSSKNVDRRSGVAFDGSGFGLSLSYSIIKQHGGTILASSQPNSGSQFSIYIPAALGLAVKQVSELQVEKLEMQQPESAELAGFHSKQERSLSTRLPDEDSE